MTLEFRPIRVATGSDDQEGLLAFANGQLVAVLVRLSELHDKMAGSWFLEACFGIRDKDGISSDLESAQEWLLARLRLEQSSEADQANAPLARR
jgi:hypothetical protein